jgi:hypothetical protein
MRKFIFIGLLLIGCGSSDSTPVPAELIDAKEMVQILADIHIADAFLTAKQVNLDSIPSLVPGYHTQIFEDHRVEEVEFMRTFDWYMDHPEKMESLYAEVLAELTRRASEVKE